MTESPTHPGAQDARRKTFPQPPRGTQLRSPTHPPQKTWPWRAPEQARSERLSVYSDSGSESFSVVGRGLLLQLARQFEQARVGRKAIEELRQV